MSIVWVWRSWDSCGHVNKGLFWALYFVAFSVVSIFFFPLVLWGLNYCCLILFYKQIWNQGLWGSDFVFFSQDCFWFLDPLGFHKDFRVSVLGCWKQSFTIIIESTRLTLKIVWIDLFSQSNLEMFSYVLLFFYQP